MFTRENIAASIREIIQGPMTPGSTSVLADLVYIHRHWPESEALIFGDVESKIKPLTPEQAQQWVSAMKNADGTTGRHWTME